MEHLHVDDAKEQLEQIFRALRPGGVYVCVTPNRLCGPHDVSGHFDAEPTGLHLKEYNNQDLIALFDEVGFSKFKVFLSYKQFVLPGLLPILPFVLYEKMICIAPKNLRRVLAKALIGVKFVAMK